MEQITEKDIWTVIGVGLFVVILGVIVILAANATPPTVEPNTGETANNMDDWEPVDFKSILDSEMPYIPYN